MSAPRPGSGQVARPRWRAYLLLARVSNLPTVWSNVLAGLIAAGAEFSWPAFIRLSAGVSLLYTAGMFLNDAFDRDVDAKLRPDRPIPSGNVPGGEAFAIGFALLAAGAIVVALERSSASTLLWTLMLVAAIVYYDYRHKRDTFGPAVMGVCRGLVYCVAASAVSAVIPPAVFAAAVVMVIYVVTLTWIAKRAGPRAGWSIPILIAGISVVDAAVVALNGGGTLAFLALAGFALTLLLQRVVPGT